MCDVEKSTDLGPVSESLSRQAAPPRHQSTLRTNVRAAHCLYSTDTRPRLKPGSSWFSTVVQPNHRIPVRVPWSGADVALHHSKRLDVRFTTDAELTALLKKGRYTGFTCDTLSLREWRHNVELSSVGLTRAQVET